MNTFLYTKALNQVDGEKQSNRYNYFLMMSFIAAILASAFFSNANASNKSSNEMNSMYVHEVLLNTEVAIELLHSSPEEAMEKISTSLMLINKIELQFDQNTFTKVQEDKSSLLPVSYTHYFPKVNISELSHDKALPVLSNKIKSNILYKGSSVKDVADTDAWFDYSFAKASLITVREAINANHSVEAMSHLKRVFEALYINPDFEVSEQS